MEIKRAAHIDRPGRGRRLAVAVLLLWVAFWMRTFQLAEVPPGLMHSELLQLRAADQVGRGEWRMLYNPGYRNEPMYAPVLAASQSILGANPLGRRFPSIFAGLIGLSLVYALAVRTLGGRIALIALGASAVVWWSVVMQRIILRQVLVMPLYALCLYAFWRGYEEVTRAGRPGWRYFIIGGVALGAAQYDHTIPRGLFVVFVLFGLYLLLFHRPVFKRLWRGILVLVLVAEVLAAPLLLYANQNPDENALPPADLFQENGLVTFAARLPATLSKVMGQFFWAGEGPDATEYDIPYRPIFEPVGAILFGLGLLVALWRWRRPVYAYLLIAWAVVLTPSLLFDADILFSRLVSAQTTTYIFLGLGVETLALGLKRLLTDRVRLVVVTAGLVGLFGVYLVVTAHDLFVVWPSIHGVKWGYNTDLRDLGRYLNAQPQPLPPVSVCTIMNNPEYHASVAQLGAPFLVQRPEAQLAWHDCRYSMVIPAGGRYLYAYPALEPLADFLGRAVQSPWLDAPYAQPVEGLNAVRRVDVRSALADKLAEWQQLAVAWPPEAAESSPAQLPVDFDRSIELIGYAANPSTVKPGSDLAVMTYWRVLGPVPDDLILFTHLYRTPEEIMAQQDQLDVVGSSLRPGDIFAQVHEFVTVPAETPPGSYWIGLGAYHQDSGERLPILVGDQRAATRLFLTQVHVAP
jgi:4-amino-4-deoxy-L-arabinose transferase-like glycosyltransferase